MNDSRRLSLASITGARDQAANGAYSSLSCMRLIVHSTAGGEARFAGARRLQLRRTVCMMTGVLLPCKY